MDANVNGMRPDSKEVKLVGLNNKSAFIVINSTVGGV